MKDLFISNFSTDTQAEIDDALFTISKKGAGEIEWPISRRLSVFFFIFILIALGGLAARLVYLNVVRGSYYQAVAADNSIRSIVLPAPRGIIYDRYGKPLVENLPSLEAVVVPEDLPDEGAARSAVLDRVKSLLALDDAAWKELQDHLAADTTAPFLIKENLSQDEIIILSSEAKDLPGISLLKSARRHYIDSSDFSAVLGYEGKIQKEELAEHPDYLLTDTIGKQGLEKSYDAVLRGKHGAEQVEVDALGHIKTELGILPPQPGNDLVLNIDADLQKKVTQTLSDWLAGHDLKSAAAVALDPKTGGVLSLVSLPSFDNNLFAGGISSNDYVRLSSDVYTPLFNRAISGTYPPGSTIKPLLASAALSEKIITPDRQIESKGGISIGNFHFGDWRVNGFTDIRRAIAVSSDVYFYSIGGGYGDVPGLGMDRMKKYENLFGWGAKTGIDLPSEDAGLIPDPDWKLKHFGERWYIGDDYHAAIGQGFVTATPLQIANAYAAIANGGTLYQPEIVSNVRSSADGSVQKTAPVIIRSHIIDPSILQIVREGMRETVTEGTATSLNTLPFTVAGKTGTAEFGNAAKTHGWFASFAPYEDPKIVLVVLVEGQDGEGYNAVPITKDILAWYFSRPE